ncbi:hypothetical protein EG329_014267 [Mollisiaceae sp. DMI_Dod_QoI]|nr:hypothetical protein EG329_014267 [Helotiales sp. DMI_Dod_QoI]
MARPLIGLPPICNPYAKDCPPSYTQPPPTPDGPAEATICTCTNTSTSKAVTSPICERSGGLRTTGTAYGLPYTQKMCLLAYAPSASAFTTAACSAQYGTGWEGYCTTVTVYPQSQAADVAA